MNRVIETLPGIVRFSYDEPVAHGFHGITYELDGAPLPSSTSSNFANLIDPRDAGAIEVFTGAFPAEFGGSRMGAVVNVQSLQVQTPPGPGTVLLGAGELGTQEAQLAKRFDVGKAQIALSVDNLAGDRGLDTPSENAIHDASSTTNQFVRIALPMTDRDTLALDLSNQYATYQIPINTNPNDVDAGEVSLPSQDDVQREYDRFAALSYTHDDKDGNGYVRIVPWTRYNRVAYDGDLAADVQGYAIGTAVSPQSCAVPVVNGYDCPTNGLVQDRAATYVGLRLSAERTSARHTLTYGLDLQQEAFRSNLAIAFAPGENPAGAGSFVDDTAQRGSSSAAYLEDVWSLSPALTLKPGLRYDHSTGYVSGSQISPRFELDAGVAPGTIAHAYVGRLYAAPGLEDTRRAAVVTETSPTANPVYNLQPERDTYFESASRTSSARPAPLLNAFDRTVVNVLDTTNLLNTPLFAVYNSAIGVTRGSRRGTRGRRQDRCGRVVHLFALPRRRRLRRNVPLRAARRHRSDAAAGGPRRDVRRRRARHAALRLRLARASRRWKRSTAPASRSRFSTAPADGFRRTSSSTPRWDARRSARISATSFPSTTCSTTAI